MRTIVGYRPLAIDYEVLPPFANTKSLQFDGVNDYVDLGSSTGLGFSNDFTLSAWIKTSAIGTNQMIIDSSTASNGSGYSMYLRSTGKIRFWSYLATNDINSITTLLPNTWYHICATHDRIGLENKLYINGVLDVSGASGSFNPTPMTNLRIGTSALFGFPFNGNIDEPCFFNRKLIQSEITTLATAPTVDLTPLNPIAWYRMGDNGAYKDPQWLIPSNENKDKVSNYSFQLDGINDYIDCGDSDDFSFGDGATDSAFSVSTWFKMSSFNTNNVVFSKDSGLPNREYAIGFFGTSQKLRFYIKDQGGNNQQSIDSTTLFALDTWYNVVCTYDGSGGSNAADGMKIYVNKVLEIPTNVIKGTYVAMSNTTAPVNIGRYGAAASPLPATVDEVSVYDSELLQADVDSIYGVGEPTTISGAIAHWRMGEEANFTSNWLVDNSALDNYSKRSFELDGIGDYVDLGDSDDFSFGNGTTDSPFTISAWIKMDSTSGFRIFNKSLGATSEYQFGTGGGGTLQLYLFNSTSNFIYRARVYTTVLNTGQWYHVAATYSGVGGTNAQDGIKIYVDGVRVDDSSVSGGTYVAMGNTTAPAYIGKLDSSYANGNVDEVSVFNSVVDIADLWDGSGEPIDVSGVSGIVSDYRMGEDASFNGTNWTVPDNVGTNNGTTNSMMVDALIGEAPNYSGGGLSNGMNIFDRIGEAPNSENNALSFNMDFVDVVPDVPPTVPFFNTKSLSFDGMDDYVATNSKIIGSDITLSAWVNFNGGSYTTFIAQFPLSITPSNSAAPNETLGRFFKSGRGMEITIQCFDQTGGNFSTYSVTSFDFEGAGWQHVCWTYNVTTKHIYVYLNGVAQTWTNFGGTITTPYLTAVGSRLYESDLTIGRQKPTTPTGTYLGLVDEVSTFNRIVTPAEIVTLSTAPTVDLTSLNPIAWYRNGDNGSYKSPQWLIPNNENKDKVSNYSMEFDGIDDYVDTGITTTGTNDVTISSWIKTTETFVYTESRCAFGGIDLTFGGSYTLGRLGSEFSTPDKMAVRVFNTVGTTKLNDGNWHHIAFTYDYTTKEIKAYTDGNLEVTLVNTLFRSKKIAIGWNGQAQRFQGNVDECALWYSVLNASEITDIYNGGTPTDLSLLATPPTNWYRMGENATFVYGANPDGTWSVPDEIGTNDGTSNNAMADSARVGDAPSSTNNALSFNMDFVDVVPDTP